MPIQRDTEELTWVTVRVPGKEHGPSAQGQGHRWRDDSMHITALLSPGKDGKPSLSAQPGPSVTWGEKVTLQCRSEDRADTFHLHREGSLHPPQQLHLQDTAAPSQANFTISPVTWGHSGTYRCYSSHSSSPFQLSQPSDPLELLVSGLRWGPWDQVQAGVRPKPSIWADPGPIVSKGSPVTIWCQGSLQADGYILYKERSSDPLDTRIPQASSNKTGFLIQSISSQNTGLYQCAYSTGGRLSERSEPLLLVLTGEHSGPSLSAQPGPVVTSGGNVSLLCSSQSTLDTVHLLKEGGAEPPQHWKSELRSYERRWQAVFPVGPVNSSHGGTYRCCGSSSSTPNVWSQPSAPLHLEVTGVYREPSLSAHPGPLLLPGDSLTLQCHSEPGFDRFALTKEQGPTHLQRFHKQHSPNFSLGPVNLTHRGRYRCYSGHKLSYVWSAPSAPLDILIAGKDSKPSLSVQPGPSVPLGANVTLQCRSEDRADTFHLHREGSLDPPQQLRLQDTAAPSQANFTISPVTSGHHGTYRCYSSRSSSPFQLSQPSDPLELVVSGLQLSLNILIGVSGALVLLLSLLLFLLLRHRCQCKSRMSGAALKDPQPGEGLELDPQHNGPDDSSKQVTYAQVNCRSRLRQGVATSPSPLSEELLDKKGRQAEEDRQMDSQAAAAEDPKDVTYAQLTLMTSRRETSAPPCSPSEQPSDEPSVYATLAVH
ncbi:leukocyte immunoglobulin-like receptor subfamily A member 3 isoform X2 [Artibeus jamaicensis]|uniref:leukocyte immunoglobulin-like receptor subfamily A member 3 isoform X2 n=1 Tax=Artibeus jamaicensis TaxID=9417 RepID=UPI00235A81C1|nr:leukocyte immunoglobulin-like receptor subfamily A member 3 isoform X2 [Artibeus jamaicensis]